MKKQEVETLISKKKKKKTKNKINGEIVQIIEVVRVGGGQKEVETVVDNNIQQGVFKQNSTIIDKTIININSLNSKKATTEKYYPQILTKRLHNEIEDYVKLLQSVVQSQKGKTYE